MEESKLISNVKASFLKLKHFCESENYKGWDPYDGMNSLLFQATPLKHWYYSRLAWIQFFKRSPINLRSLLLVPKEHNPKGIGLFLEAYCNLYKISSSKNIEFGERIEILETINMLADLLINMESSGYSGSCWGYNFDWQNREVYRPRHTPTVVATSFCGEALFKAYEITRNESHLRSALSSCNFVVNDLNRTDVSSNEFIFSYSPLDNSRVYNASLLGAKLLSIGFKYTNNLDWYDLSRRATHTIVNRQELDGSWVYGEHLVQTWKDSFHTGFNLECIWKVAENLQDSSLNKSFEKGLDFYLNSFFTSDYIPKYYNYKKYPIDIHSPAQLITTLYQTDKLPRYRELAHGVMNWTLENMFNDKYGTFKYQLKPWFSSNITYMRWAQAWMFRSFTEYISFFEYEDLDRLD